MEHKTRALAVCLICFASTSVAQEVLRGGDALSGGDGSASRVAVPQAVRDKPVKRMSPVELRREQTRINQMEAQRKLEALRMEQAQRYGRNKARSAPETPAVTGQSMAEAQSVLATLAQKLGLSSNAQQAMERIISETQSEPATDLLASAIEAELAPVTEMRRRAEMRAASVGLISGDVQSVQSLSAAGRDLAQSRRNVTEGQALYREMDVSAPSATPFSLTTALAERHAAALPPTQDAVNAAQQRRHALKAQARALFAAHAAQVAALPGQAQPQAGLTTAQAAAIETADLAVQVAADARAPDPVVDVEAPEKFSLAKLLTRLK